MAEKGRLPLVMRNRCLEHAGNTKRKERKRLQFSEMYEEVREATRRKDEEGFKVTTHGKRLDMEEG